MLQITRNQLSAPQSQPSSNSKSGVLKAVSGYLILLLIFILPFRGWVTIMEDVTIAVPIGALVGGIWVASLGVNPIIRRPRPFHILFGVFVLWMGITSIWSIDPSRSLITTIRFALYGGIGLAIWDLFRTRRLIELALFAYMLGAFFTMSVELYYFLTLGLERVSTLSNPNYLSGRLLFAFPFAWYFAFDKEYSTISVYQVISILFIIILVPTIIWTQSRQGLIAMVVGIVIFIALSDRFRKYLSLAPVAIGMILVYAKMFLGDSFDKIPNVIGGILTVVTGGTVEDPTTTRIEIVDGAMDLVSARPFMGYGIDNFSEAFETMHGIPWTAHSSILAITVETGIIGLVWFLSLFVLLLRGVFSRMYTIPILGYLGILSVLSLTNVWQSGFAAWGNIFVLYSALHAEVRA